jgi:hypothetical protein
MKDEGNYEKKKYAHRYMRRKVLRGTQQVEEEVGSRFLNERIEVRGCLFSDNFVE